MDPEAELSNVMRKFQNLAPQCSVEKRAGGIPQLAPQEKQIGILKHEMKETRLCINLAKKGQHAIRDENIKKGIFNNIIEYEDLESEVKDEKGQLQEINLLNYLAGKVVYDLSKKVMSESDEIARFEFANNSLRRMENRLDMAIKRFCLVNTENKKIREEIDILLVERESFNIQWKRVINRLVKGKEYMADILEIATKMFGERDESCRILETLMWKGLGQLNKDIAEMQSYDSELNHLAKLEEFLRVKGSTRKCEAEEKEEAKRLEEEYRCIKEIARHDELLEEIFEYAGTDRVTEIIRKFGQAEIDMMTTFILLCSVLEETIFLKKCLERLRHSILDQQDINCGRDVSQERNLAVLTLKLMEQKERTEVKLQENMAADAKLVALLKSIDELFRIARCNAAPLATLLGNHLEVTKWNVNKFLRILECEVVNLVQVVYSAVKPPAQTPRGKAAPKPVKIVADPKYEALVPNRIESLVPYQPCAYCVEDYMMNQVFETPAVPANKDYINSIFHLEDINTKFGIYTLTIPAPVANSSFLAGGLLAEGPWHFDDTCPPVVPPLIDNKSPPVILHYIF